MISADEEVALAQRISNGELAALDRLVEANLRFVVSVAKISFVGIAFCSSVFHSVLKHLPLNSLPAFLFDYPYPV